MDDYPLLSAFEDHELGCLLRQRSLRPHGSMTHGGKYALDWVRGAQVVPMLGRKVEEGEQRLTVFGQASNGLVVLGAVFVGEAVDGGLGCRACWSAVDLAEVRLHVDLD